ncbi:MAG TPA: helix-turn-helix domain-containing protein, partial [Actinomycetes bacterium]
HKIVCGSTEDRMNARRPKTPLTLELVTAPSESERARATRRENPNAERQIVDVTLRADDRLLLPVDEAARRLSIGRSLLYELLAAGEIHSIHVGRLRRVPISALTEFVNRQSNESRTATGSATSA